MSPTFARDPTLPLAQKVGAGRHCARRAPGAPSGRHLGRERGTFPGVMASESPPSGARAPSSAQRWRPGAPSCASGPPGAPTSAPQELSSNSKYIYTAYLSICCRSRSHFPAALSPRLVGPAERPASSRGLCAGPGLLSPPGSPSPAATGGYSDCEAALGARAPCSAPSPCPGPPPEGDNTSPQPPASSSLGGIVGAPPTTPGLLRNQRAPAPDHALERSSFHVCPRPFPAHPPARQNFIVHICDFPTAACALLKFFRPGLYTFRGAKLRI